MNDRIETTCRLARIEAGNGRIHRLVALLIGMQAITLAVLIAGMLP